MRKLVGPTQGGLRGTLLGIALLAAAVLAGCGTVIHERHFFASFVDDHDGKREPAQFFRVKVDGNTSFSNTRYLTGYFDERAVSLFFNEIKAPANQRLFDDATVISGAPAGTKLTPLSPTADNGAFVLIMSTNADAVASTIGSFAESQVVADALIVCRVVTPSLAYNVRFADDHQFAAMTQSSLALASQGTEGPECTDDC